MSQRFNLNFDEMRQKNTDAVSDQEDQTVRSEQDLHYPSYGNVRNICFAWPDGRKLFLNYSYLIAAECDTLPSQMILTFSTHMITIKGYNLQSLFFELMDQRLRLLCCMEDRYNALQPEGAPVVNEILVAPT